MLSVIGVLFAGLVLLGAVTRGIDGLRRGYLLVTVRGASMEPTLRDGDRVLARRCGCDQRHSSGRRRWWGQSGWSGGRGVTGPRVGDLVVFSDAVDLAVVPPELRALLPARPAVDQQAWVVKRVLAVPGDPVPRAHIPVLAGVDHDVVPTGCLVVVGDNPAISHDSRQYGYVAGERVLAIVVRHC